VCGHLIFKKTWNNVKYRMTRVAI